jgi:hypothetical protein
MKVLALEKCTFDTPSVPIKFLDRLQALEVTRYEIQYPPGVNMWGIYKRLVTRTETAEKYEREVTRGWKHVQITRTGPL